MCVQPCERRTFGETVGAELVAELLEEFGEIIAHCLLDVGHGDGRPPGCHALKITTKLSQLI